MTTQSSLPQLIIVADLPESSTELCGISLLERLRRIAEQIGFRKATILSNSIESIMTHLAGSRSNALALEFRKRQGLEISVGDVLECIAPADEPHPARILVVFAGYYCDGRLLRVMGEAAAPSVLIDSDPPPQIRPLLENGEPQPVCAILLSKEWFAGRNRDAGLKKEVVSDAMAGRLASIDAAKQNCYVRRMRRDIRPFFFPAPTPNHRPLAERLLCDQTQKGVVDFPALVHAPIENWLISHLCRTRLTPNQITLGTAVVGGCVTWLYASGHLFWGALLALVVGILDGLDGKLARLKVQTSKAGEVEHVLDYFIEMSWWTGLAYHFHITGQVHHPFVLLFGLVFSDFLERMARRTVEPRLGRNLDEVSRFDRFVRLVAGRRNIYTWIFTFFLLVGLPAKGFVCLCWWGIASAAVHVIRAGQILFVRQWQAERA